MGGKHKVPVDMRKRRFGYFPMEFVMEGALEQVACVNRVFTKGTKHMDSHHFDCTLADGNTLEVVQDLNSNTWYALV